MPTAYALIQRETAAGHRRYYGTPVGEQYGHAISHYGENAPANPTIDERPLGDLLAPYGPRMMDVVNRVSRVIGADAAGWTVDRLVSMVGQLEREARQRETVE